METKESASARNMKLPQLNKRREFDISKLHLYGDPGEKHGAISGQNDCQKIGLGALSITQQFQWHKNLINMVPSGH